MSAELTLPYPFCVGVMLHIMGVLIFALLYVGKLDIQTGFCEEI